MTPRAKYEASEPTWRLEDDIRRNVEEAEVPKPLREYYMKILK